MKNWLKSLDPHILKLLREIGEKAQAHGLSAFVVGGVVRDIILGRGNLDIDIVVDGDVLSLAQKLSQELNASIIVYKQFKTATIVLPDGLRIDFASARKEFYPHPGALPVVSEGTVQDDLFRRDFTVNAMALCLYPDIFGQLRDDFKGFEDLRKKTIRVLHPRSFLDDPTRVLRAIRFEQRFGFKIERKTLRLLTSALKKNAVSTVKPPRYFEEFKKILVEENPLKPLSRLSALGGMDFVGINRKDFARNVSLLKSARREVVWFENLDSGKKFQRWLVYFMALMFGRSTSRIEKMLKSFQLSNADGKKVLQGNNARQIITALGQPSLKPSQISESLRPFANECLVFLRAIAGSQLEKRRIEDFLLKYSSVSLKMTGDDLIRLGVPAGKNVGMILKTILDFKIDGEIYSKEDEISKAQQLLSRFQ